MNDLFDDGSKPGTKGDQRFDWMTLFAREKFNAPEGWERYSWSRKNFDTAHEFILIEGAVCTAVFEKGKRRGAKNWSFATNRPR